MQSSTAALRATLAKKNPTYKKVVELYRRYWDADSSAYAYAAAQDITDQVVECGRIMWKLDKEEYGSFNLDNTTITFRNDRQQWKQDNPKGYFPSTHILAKSKVKVKIGAQLADGSFETLYVFTGYINSDPTYNVEEKTAQLTLYGAMTIFDDFNAEEISTLVEDELLGSDSGTEFTTANNGVGIIVELKRGTTLENAVEIKPSSDYSASQQNDSTLPLKITLNTALSAGEKLYISYRYWYTDKSLEWIVEQIMTLCGISAYSVSKAVFATSVETIEEYTDQADWQGFTDTNADAWDKTSSPGNVKLAAGFPAELSGISWTEVEICANTSWQIVSGSYGEGVQSYGFIGNSVGWSSIKSSQSETEGTWQFFVGYDSRYGGYAFGYHHFMSSNGDRATSDGYAVGMVYEAGAWKQKFYRVDAGTLTELASIAYAGSYFRIKRESGGVFKVWVDGTLMVEVTDNTYTSSSYQVAAFYWNMNKGATGFSKPATGGFAFSPEIATAGRDAYGSNYWPYATMDSPVIDCTADIVSYGPIQSSVVLPSGASVQLYTYSSDSSDFSSGTDPAGWVAVDSIGTPTSAVKRYLKVRYKAWANTAQTSTPDLLWLKVYFYTSTTNINLVNLTGMTCKTALEQIAQMCNYEIGFNASDSFIFRPRTSGAAAVLAIDDDTNLRELLDVQPGIDRIYNRVRAIFGSYDKVSDASTDTAPNSITKYGTREYAVSNSQLLPAENVNMAYSVAPTILAYTKTPRRRARVLLMLRPDLELGDKVTLSHREDSALRIWYWGDTRARYGQPDLEYWNAAAAALRLSFWQTDMRVEGIEIDPEEYTCTLDLTEVVE